MRDRVGSVERAGAVRQRRTNERRLHDLAPVVGVEDDVLAVLRLRDEHVVAAPVLRLRLDVVELAPVSSERPGRRRQVVHFAEDLAGARDLLRPVAAVEDDREGTDDALLLVRDGDSARLDVAHRVLRVLSVQDLADETDRRGDERTAARLGRVLREEPSLARVASVSDHRRDTSGADGHEAVAEARSLLDVHVAEADDAVAAVRDDELRDAVDAVLDDVRRDLELAAFLADAHLELGIERLALAGGEQVEDVMKGVDLAGTTVAVVQEDATAPEVRLMLAVEGGREREGHVVAGGVLAVFGDEAVDEVRVLRPLDDERDDDRHPRRVTFLVGDEGREVALADRRDREEHRLRAVVSEESAEVRVDEFLERFGEGRRLRVLALLDVVAEDHVRTVRAVDESAHRAADADAVDEGAGRVAEDLTVLVLQRRELQVVRLRLDAGQFAAVGLRLGELPLSAERLQRVGDRRERGGERGRFVDEAQAGEVLLRELIRRGNDDDELPVAEGGRPGAAEDDEGRLSLAARHFDDELSADEDRPLEGLQELLDHELRRRMLEEDAAKALDEEREVVPAFLDPFRIHRSRDLVELVRERDVLAHALGRRERPAALQAVRPLQQGRGRRIVAVHTAKRRGLRALVRHRDADVEVPALLVGERRRVAAAVRRGARKIEGLDADGHQSWNPPCEMSPPMRQPCFRSTISNGSFLQSCVTRAYIGE